MARITSHEMPESEIAKQDQRDRLFLGLQLFHFVNDGLILLYPIIMVEYFTLFDLKYYEIGLVYSMNTLMLIIMQIINGYLADRGYVKFLLIFGVLGVTLSSFLLHLVVNFVTLFSVSVISGFFFGIVHAINYATTIRLYPENSNLKLARQGFMGDLGKLIAIFLSSILTMLLPLAITIVTWNTVCVIAAIFVIWNTKDVRLPGISTKNAEVDAGLDSVDGISSFGFIKGAFLIFLLQFLFNAYFDLILKNTPTYLYDTRTGPLSEYSRIVFAVLYFIGTIGIFNADLFRRKLGRKRHFIVAYATMITTLLIFQLLATDSVLVTILLLGPNFAIGLSIYTNIFDEVSKHVGKKKLGFNMSLLLAFGWFGGFASTYIGGKIADVNPDFIIWQAIIVNVLSMVITIILIKTKKLND